MTNSDSSFQQILEHYRLTEEECEKEVSDKHITCFFCEEWKKLPPYLDLEATVAGDLERDFKTEEERREALLKKWKKRKGFEATYKKLITALLEINCREEAEQVCKLLSISACPPALEATYPQIILRLKYQLQVGS